MQRMMSKIADFLYTGAVCLVLPCVSFTIQHISSYYDWLDCPLHVCSIVLKNDIIVNW
jgi:hypothetical protein